MNCEFVLSFYIMNFLPLSPVVSYSKSMAKLGYHLFYPVNVSFIVCSLLCVYVYKMQDAGLTISWSVPKFDLC